MDYDVIVIGGGAAGLSATLGLGRARRRVLVLDAGEPSNAPAHAIGGLLGQRGTSPLELLEVGRAQLAELPTVEVRRGVTARSARAHDDRVEVDGITAEVLLVATGAHYARPELPGLEPLWGDTVFHCPFCHGWEVAGRPLAVMMEGPHAPVMGQLLKAWSDDVVLLTDPGALDDAARGALDAAGVAVDGREVAELRARNGRLDAIVFADGSTLPRAGLLIRAPLQARPAPLLDALGLERSEHGTLATQGWGRTNVPRVWAAGDVAEPGPAVAVAIAAGARAAGGIMHDLMIRAAG
jgi:thioredoxin reductase